MNFVVFDSLETPDGTLKLQTSSLFRDALILVFEPKVGGVPHIISLERDTSEWLVKALPPAHRMVFEQN